MMKPYSTKRWKAVPPEFEQFFIREGWNRSNHAFGKRETLRYVRELGSERLALCRKAQVRKTRGQG